MAGFPVKCILLVIILSLSSAVAGQPDEKPNNISFNISVVVNDIGGNPISGALVKSVDPAGSPVLKQTDSKGRVDIELTKNSNLNVKADGYRDWVSREPVSPGMLVLTLESMPTNANFHILDARSNDIPDAFVIVEDSTGNTVVKISDAKGKASAQASQGRANITIKAEGYREFNDNSAIILENSTYTYVLNSKIDSGVIIWDLFALMIPFLFMLYISLVEWPETPKYDQWYAYMPAIGWVISFALLISGAFAADDYTIYFLDPALKVSLFVPIAAFIGATSHITVSILKNIERAPLELKWKLIYVAYGRRLFIAPYIAVIAVFTILEVAQLKNPWAVLFFAYFVGLYTKQIEGTLEEIGKKFLTDKQKKELEERDMEALEIVKLFGVSTGVAAKLNVLGMRESNDLIAIPDDKIKETAEKAGVDEAYLSALKERAKSHVNKIKAMGD